MKYTKRPIESAIHRTEGGREAIMSEGGRKAEAGRKGGGPASGREGRKRRMRKRLRGREGPTRIHVVGGVSTQHCLINTSPHTQPVHPVHATAHP